MFWHRIFFFRGTYTSYTSFLFLSLYILQWFFYIHEELWFLFFLGYTWMCIYDWLSTTKIHLPRCNPNRTQQQYGDLRFQDLERGIQFGVRYLLNHILFSFFNPHVEDGRRRLFVLYWSIFPELPIPMEQRFHRGWTHSVRYAVRPEESMLLFFS